ncbi:uncharacterized protein LOC142470069 [Ascaphus truei]|uniref:uncharacterized protein LOC142470069 n=1 Tax=Ascaphus truei TaxID=8439 RepID=UPI003F5A0393
MYNNRKYSNEMATAKVENPRGAESPKWRTEADGGSACSVRSAEEQATDVTLASLLWSGAKAVAAPFWSCLGPRSITPDDSEEHIVVMCGENGEFACQSAYNTQKATSVAKEIGDANQNGGSSFPGRPRGPVAENSANTGLAESWPGVAPTGKPHPDGEYGPKAAAAPSWTMTNSAPVLGHPINLWDLPLISTRGSGFQLCPVGMDLAEQRAGEPVVPLQKVVPVISAARGKEEKDFASKMAAGNWPGLAPNKELRSGGSGAKSEAAPPRTVKSSASVPGHPINLWDLPQIFTRGRGLYLCQARPELSEGGAGCELPVPQLQGAGEQERPLCKVSSITSTTKSEMDIGVYPYSLPGVFLVVKVGDKETLRCLCMQCRLPSGEASTTARCPQCGIHYLGAVQPFVPGQTVEAGADTAKLTAEASPLVKQEPVDPGEWG